MIERGDLLVVRNDRLGDTVLALPVIPLIRNVFPSIKLYFLADPRVAPLLRCIEGIDDVIEGDEHGRIDVVTELKHLNIRTALCLRSTYQNALTLFRARIPERIGTIRRYYSVLYTTRINLPRRRQGRHEADLNLDLLAAAGIRGNTSFPEFNLPQASIAKIERLLQAKGIDPNEPFIVVHPGSGGSSQTWSPTYFRKFCSLFSDEFSLPILVTGSEVEREMCSAVAGEEHVNLCGKTDLLELASLLSQARMLLSNSTGPLHLSVALGTTSIGLYPPLPDSAPERWGPYERPEWALVPDLKECKRCKPGQISACWCMEQLTPDYVFDHVRNILS